MTTQPVATTSNALLLSAELILHTRRSRQYFFNPQYGVLAFVKQLKSVYDAAAHDDPYADQLLLRLYDACLQEERQLKALEEQLTGQLQTQSKLHLNPLVSNNPLHLTLKFGTPWGYWAANLVGYFDSIACIVFSLQRVGLPDDKPNPELLPDIQKRLQALLTLPAVWQATGVTREDIQNHTDKAQQAKTVFKKLNAQVLAGTLRAPFPFAPLIKVNINKATQNKNSREAEN